MGANRTSQPLDRLGPRAPAQAVPVDREPVDGGPVDDREPVIREPDVELWGYSRAPAWLDPPAVTADSDPDDIDDQPPRFGRWHSAPRAAIAIVAVGVLAIAVAAYSVFGGGADDSATAARVSFPATPGSSLAGKSSAAPTELVVSVVGLVHKPGLVRLAPQSRVADAIDRAGGARPGADVTSVNLAQLLRDGDQILIGFADPVSGPKIRSSVVAAGGTSGEGPQPTANNGGQAPTSGSKINLNTATEQQLDALPGVGPVTAKAILAWRQQHGKFATVEQLGEVEGIGPARLAKLKELVTV